MYRRRNRFNYICRYKVIFNIKLL